MTKLHCYHSAVKMIRNRATMLLVLFSILCLPMLNPSSATNASKTFVAPPKIMKVAALQFDGGGGDDSFTCRGNSCYRQILICQNGILTPDGDCCIKCHNSGEEVRGCCTPRESGGGPGDILP
jgi:hypothetical protein